MVVQLSETITAILSNNLEIVQDIGKFILKNHNKQLLYPNSSSNIFKSYSYKFAVIKTIHKKKLLVQLPSHQRPRREKRPMYPKNFCTSTLSPSDPEDFFSSTVLSTPVI